MNTPRIIVRLMLDNEHLRFENGQYRIALFGCEVEPQSPFPALTGDEVLRILHPRDAHRGRPCR